LDLQLPVQSVPTTAKVVSSNPVHGEVYSLQHYYLTIWVISEENIKQTCTKMNSGLVWIMVFNATFNIISAISWPSVLLVVETGVRGKNN
jgi:hypothetical protein